MIELVVLLLVVAVWLVVWWHLSEYLFSRWPYSAVIVFGVVAGFLVFTAAVGTVTIGLLGRVS